MFQSAACSNLHTAAGTSHKPWQTGAKFRRIESAMIQKGNEPILYGHHQCFELKSVFSKKQHKCVQMKEYYIKTRLQVSRKEIKPLCFTLVITAS